jgi:hypothetical protein
MAETYLPAFKACVQEAGVEAVMGAYNRTNGEPCCGSKTLLKDILRDEWGFNGFVLTDYFGVYGYMSSDQAIRNGTDCMLVNYPTATNNVQFRDTNGAQQAMREATKNILYTVVNVNDRESDCIFYNYVTGEKLTAKNADIDLQDMWVAYVINNTPYVRKYIENSCEFVNLSTAENDSVAFST